MQDLSRTLLVLVGLAGLASSGAAQVPRDAGVEGDALAALLLGGTVAPWSRHPGEVRTLEVRRENRAVDREGRTVGWTVAEGVVERTLLEPMGTGTWLEELRWRRYAFAEVMGSASKPPPVDVPDAAGATFTSVTGRYGPGDYPDVEVDGVQGPAGRTLAVLGLDAVTWDAVVGLLRAAHPDGLRIGSDARDVGEPDSLRDVGPGMRYALGALEATVAGATRIDDEPALLVRFAADGSRLVFEGDAGPARVRVNGTEFFTGWAAVSLVDGRILEGELSGPVISRTEVVAPGSDPTELPVGGTQQRVWLRELRGGAGP